MVFLFSLFNVLHILWNVHFSKFLVYWNATWIRKEREGLGLHTAALLLTRSLKKVSPSPVYCSPTTSHSFLLLIVQTYILLFSWYTAWNDDGGRLSCDIAFLPIFLSTEAVQQRNKELMDKNWLFLFYFNWFLRLTTTNDCSSIYLEIYAYKSSHQNKKEKKVSFGFGGVVWLSSLISSLLSTRLSSLSQPSGIHNLLVRGRTDAEWMNQALVSKKIEKDMTSTSSYKNQHTYLSFF